MAETIHPEQLRARMSAGGPVRLIDVRTAGEFRRVHAVGAELMPLDRLDPAGLTSAGPIYVICQSGARSAMACDRLTAAGVGQAVSVDGGTAAWASAGLPVERGPGMSIERQVRVGAGSLVLVGCGLGWAVHPAWFGLAAFVGGGLVFAGVSGLCGMGRALSWMPWNR